MKTIYTLIFFFALSNAIIAQEISGVVLDSVSKKPLELASVTLNKTNQGVYSDAQGKFNINLIKANDYLLISYLGYNSKKLTTADFLKAKKNNTIFYLSPITEELHEVLVQRKKINHGWAKTIKSKRENTQYFGFQFGTENCTYVENPDRKQGKIKAVVLDLRKVAEFNKDNPKWKLDYISAFKIKFYKLDGLTNKPGEELYDKDIIIEPGNKTQNLSIDVDSLNIKFPVEGICIGVEIINTKYTNPKKVFATIGPDINFTENQEMHPRMSWCRFRTEDKYEFISSSLNEDRKGRKYNMMIVDLIVNPEKK
ncbi:MAG: carboxypeptidase-like regulatory domain-containing protein [Flavobacterium sp.]